MKYFLFIIRSSIFDFSRNKGRSLLTSLGIMIGVLSVVLLVAFGLGLRRYIQNQFDDLGTNLLRVLPGKVIQNGSFRGGQPGLGVQFTQEDVVKLRRINHVDYVLPVYTKSVTSAGGGETYFSDVYASSADIFLALNLTPTYGELFEATAVDKRSKVVVIGPTVAEELYGSGQNAIGQSIKIESQSFKIIGVLEEKGGGGFGGPDFDSFIYMPYTTAFIFNTDKKFPVIIVRAESEEVLQDVKADIEEVMLREYEEDDFSVVEQTEILNAIGSIFDIMNVVLVAIAAISLIVGGIGIMNIMYVTVTERIKEIGIRRAIGARKADILYQFMVQSILLSLFGGVLGLAVAYVVVFFIQSFFPAYINAQTVALAVGVSTIIGVVFGVFPAKKAADLSPIDAIRYE